MIKKSILIATILVLGASVAFASGSISISSVSIASSVTQGDSFSITVYVSGTEATGVSSTLTLPSGLSCTPTGSQTVSLDGSGSGSAAWSCSADVAGDYSNQITASVSATDSGTGGSLSDSEQTGISVLSPASLVATSSLSASSITVSGTSSFTVAIHNTGDESTTYSVTVASSPTGVSSTVSSGSASGTITGGSVSNVIYSLSDSTADTYTVTATITGNNQTLTTSQTLAVTTTSSNSSSSGSSSGGGGGSSTVTTKKTVLFDVINPGVNGVITNLNSDLGVTKILISVNSQISSVTVSVDKLSSAPSTTGAVSGKAYKYLTVEKSVNNTVLKEITFDFSVEKSWLTNNSVDEGTVALYRYTTKWDKLATLKVNSNATHVMYEAVSPGLSYFSIAGEQSVSQCTSGQKQCSGNLVQECSSGSWLTTQTCSNGCDASTIACKSATSDNTTTTEEPVGSECTSGSKRCLGNEVQECSSGTWVRSILCSLGCNSDKLECNPYTAGNTTGELPSIPMDYVYVAIVLVIVGGLGFLYFKYFKSPGSYEYKPKKK
ncbi:MAG: PGF-pre-PGF domain-containing protein [Candidatus Aenigmarchaeota archaeon]|nr:PGF-pre-PGF domain-containing protein [Candidatus Aenigmarchaeota archaeon]